MRTLVGVVGLSALLLLGHWSRPATGEGQLLESLRCSAADVEQGHCELVLLMQWIAPRNIRYHRFCLAAEMGMDPQDEAACLSLATRLLRDGMVIRNNGEAAWERVAIIALKQAACLWVKTGTIPPFLARYADHNNVVSQALYIDGDGATILGPPLIDRGPQ